MVRAKEGNIVKTWLGGTPETSKRLAVGLALADGDIDGLFEMAQMNGARLHEIAAVGRFIHESSSYIPAASHLRFQALVEQGAAVQSLNPSHGISAEDISVSELIKAGISKEAFAKALRRVKENRYGGDLGSMAERAGISEGALRVYMGGTVLPTSFYDVAEAALYMDASPALLGVAYLSDRLRRERRMKEVFTGEAFAGDNHTSYAKLKLTALINMAAIVLGIDVPKIKDEIDLRQAANLAQLVKLAGFGRGMAHDTIAEYFATSGRRVQTLPMEAAYFAIEAAHRRRYDLEATGHDIASRVFEKRNAPLIAAEMSRLGLEALDGFRNESRPVQRAVEGIASGFRADIERLSASSAVKTPVAANSISARTAFAWTGVFASPLNASFVR